MSLTKKEELRKKVFGKITNLKKVAEDLLTGLWAGGDSDDEIRSWVLSFQDIRFRPIRRGIKALEMLLDDENSSEDFVYMVGWTANISLDNPTVENSRAWLREKIAWLKSILEEAEK